jgi:hypothetical protein
MFTAFQHTKSFEELSERTKPGYRKAMERLTEIRTKEGKRAGEYLLKTLTPLAADKLYAKLRIGKRGQEVFRQANLAIWLAGRAWRTARRRMTHGPRNASNSPGRWAQRLKIAANWFSTSGWVRGCCIADPPAFGPSRSPGPAASAPNRGACIVVFPLV